MKTEQKDDRLKRANLMRNLLNNEGYKTLRKEYEQVKERAHNDLTNESLPDSNLSQRQKIFNQIKEWLNIPDSIIKEGEIALAESKEPEGKSFVKKAVGFIGRRY